MSKGTTVKADVSKKVENAGTSGNRKTVMKDNIEGKDDGQILINCIKNCAFFQSSVGAKEARFREIGKEKLDLSKEREKLMLSSVICVRKLQCWRKNLQISVWKNSERCHF